MTCVELLSMALGVATFVGFAVFPDLPTTTGLAVLAMCVGFLLLLMGIDRNNGKTTVAGFTSAFVGCFITAALVDHHVGAAFAFAAVELAILALLFGFPTVDVFRAPKRDPVRGKAAHRVLAATADSFALHAVGKGGVPLGPVLGRHCAYLAWSFADGTVWVLPLFGTDPFGPLHGRPVRVVGRDAVCEEIDAFPIRNTSNCTDFDDYKNIPKGTRFLRTIRAAKASVDRFAVEVAAAIGCTHVVYRNSAEEYVPDAPPTVLQVVRGVDDAKWFCGKGAAHALLVLRPKQKAEKTESKEEEPDEPEEPEETKKSKEPQETEEPEKPEEPKETESQEPESQETESEKPAEPAEPAEPESKETEAEPDSKDSKDKEPEEPEEPDSEEPSNLDPKGPNDIGNGWFNWT